MVGFHFLYSYGRAIMRAYRTDFDEEKLLRGVMIHRRFDSPSTHVVRKLPENQTLTPVEGMTPSRDNDEERKDV